jgi:Ca2+-binding RTX toxin-like protein
MATLNVTGLLSGSSWGAMGQPVTITYSFLTTIPTYYGSPGTAGYPTNFGALTPIQQSVVLASLQEWANVAKITFSPVTQTGTTQAGTTEGQITFGIRTLGQNTAAQAAYPGASPFSGDVWLSQGFSDPVAGDYNYSTILHEIGHALGLKHPILYPGETASTNPPPYYTGQYLSRANELYTLMAYGENPYNSTWHATSPMLYDIEAIQELYGKNTTYRTGNDVYSFTPGAVQYSAIWDAGGVDEINAALFSTSVVIDLREGDYYTAIGPSNLTQFNIGIVPGAVIENATGGSGADSLVGNDIQNLLSGGGGNDTLDGGRSLAAIQPGSTGPGVGDGANDTLQGGADYDTYILRVGGGVDHLVDSGENAIVFRNELNNNDESRPKVLFQTGGTQSGQNARGTITYTMNSPLTLTDVSTGTQVVIDNFTEGDFGITIREAEAPHTDQTVTITVTGDLEPEDFDPGTPGIQTQTDALGNVIVTGNPQPGRNDSLFGDASANELDGLAGDDTLTGRAGDDDLYGRDGDDSLYGEAGWDLMYGGTGDDYLDGGADNDDMYGEDGSDILVGGAGYDVMAGGGERDLMSGTTNCMWVISLIFSTGLISPKMKSAAGLRANLPTAARAKT